MYPPDGRLCWLRRWSRWIGGSSLRTARAQTKGHLWYQLGTSGSIRDMRALNPPNSPRICNAEAKSFPKALIIKMDIQKASESRWAFPENKKQACRFSP